MGGRGGLDPYEGGDDWARYGGARSRDPNSQPDETAEDPFVAYRYENGVPASEERPPRRHTKVGLLAAMTGVVAFAAAATVFSVLVPREAPDPTASRTPRPAPTAPPSALLSLPQPTQRLAEVALTIPIPIPIFVPDRAFAFDDGTRMYLAGDAGAVPVDVAAGDVGGVWGGAGFPKGLRRVIFDRGVWVSSWPSSYAYCGPPCWDKASTYRLDPASGRVTLALEGAFLVGARYDGVYVASVGRLRVLHPEDGSEQSAASWLSPGEPRLGCGNLWSLERGQTTELRIVNDLTGVQAGGSSMPSTLSYGPVYSEGLCWMMSGQGGAAMGQTELRLLGAGGAVIEERSYGQSTVVLDSEFWRLDPDGSIQRFEALSGSGGYGTRYILPITPEGGDPATIFSAAGTMWLYRGQQLVGFDIPTGSGN